MSENAIEWLTGDERITVSFTQKKFANKLRALAKKYPDEVDLIENQDGSVFGHMPIKYLRLSHPRKISDEQRQKLSERMSKR